MNSGKAAKKAGKQAANSTAVAGGKQKGQGQDAAQQDAAQQDATQQGAAGTQIEDILSSLLGGAAGSGAGADANAAQGNGIADLLSGLLKREEEGEQLEARHHQGKTAATGTGKAAK